MLSGCGISNMMFGKGDEWIPKKFDPKQTVLLVSAFGSDKEMKKASDYMKANYPYRYEMIALKDTANKFPDKNQYRFVLLPTGQIVGNGGVYGHTAGAVDFYFYDRLENISSPSTGKGSYTGLVTFKPLITSLVSHYKKT